MRLVTYQREGMTRTGAQVGDKIIDLNRAYRVALHQKGDSSELVVADARVPTEMIALLNGGEVALEAVRQAIAFAQEAGEALQGQGIIFAAQEVTLLAPVLRPGKIICLGLNYRAHAAEAKMEVPKYPILFHKVATSIIGHQQNILKPRISNRLDYEGELALIVGKRGKHIPEAEALTYLAGYVCSNDVSARDLQFRTNQWTSGKMMDTACPLGPALVTRDEIPDPNALQLKTIVNGEVRQNANTADMIFNVAFIVSYISQIATLEPGDVILTGTPEGIGGTRKPPVFMGAGDTVSVEIEGLGMLTNPIVDEA